MFCVVAELVKKQRMMVAELGGRGQSGSPVNGEVACAMPSSRDSYLGQHEVLLSPLSPSSAAGGEYYAGGPQPGDQAAAAAAALKRKELFTQRKQREFIPDNKKDDNYWDRRRRNNEAAKRSREKRRFNDMVLEQRVVELTKENHVLKAQLEAIKEEYGICGESVVCVEKVLATLPTSDQVLSMTKRPKLTGAPLMLAAAAAAAIPTPVIHQPIHGGNGAGVMSPPPPAVLPSVAGAALQQQSPLELRAYEPVEYHHPHHTHPEQPPPSPYHHHHHSPYHYHHYHHAAEAAAAVAVAASTADDYEQNALNLSNRARARSPYDVSSGGEEAGTPPPATSGAPAASAAAAAAAADSSNNSLPLKLRHKSHLGDKDQAASALLALHNIKQEAQHVPAGSNGRHSSTPPWDGEGSSDERDSGISLGAEWTPAPADNKQRLHSEIARLSTEVANLKSLVIRTNN